MYLAWFDATPTNSAEARPGVKERKSPEQKIGEARARYVQKFGEEPRVCMVNPADVCQVEGIEVRPLNYIGRHCFWIGKDDA